MCLVSDVNNTLHAFHTNCHFIIKTFLMGKKLNSLTHVMHVSQKYFCIRGYFSPKDSHWIRSLLCLVLYIYAPDLVWLDKAQVSTTQSFPKSTTESVHFKSSSSWLRNPSPMVKRFLRSPHTHVSLATSILARPRRFPARVHSLRLALTLQWGSAIIRSNNGRACTFPLKIDLAAL